MEGVHWVAFERGGLGLHCRCSASDSDGDTKDCALLVAYYLMNALF